MSELDRARVAALAHAVMLLVRDALGQPPARPDNVYVALNALAIVVATVFVGTGPDKRVQKFFAKAVAQYTAALPAGEPIAMDHT